MGVNRATHTSGVKVPLRCVDALVRCGQELVRPFPQQELVATEIIHRHRGDSDRCCCGHPHWLPCQPQPSDSAETEVAGNTQSDTGWMCLVDVEIATTQTKITRPFPNNRSRSSAVKDPLQKDLKL
jgi:hypothetical protein